MQAMAADLDGAVELDDLDRAVLWAMRSVAVGRLDCPSLRRAMVDLYGPAADQILCALLVMVRLLANRSVKGLRMHMPGSNAVSRDELMILSAFSRRWRWCRRKPAPTPGRGSRPNSPRCWAEGSTRASPRRSSMSPSCSPTEAGDCLRRKRRAPAARSIEPTQVRRSVAAGDRTAPAGVLASNRALGRGHEDGK